MFVAMSRLSDISVLVVGPEGELLAAVVSRLVAEGAAVIVGNESDHSDHADDGGKGETRDTKGESALPVHRLGLDVTDDASWQAAIKSIESRFGSLHGLVYATSPAISGALVEMRPDQVRSTIDMNLLGPALGIATSTELMARSGGGSIVTIASTEALRGTRNGAVYSATNWGLRGLSRSAALELGNQGIRVNTVCPSVSLMGYDSTQTALDGRSPAGQTGAPVDTGALVDTGAQRVVTMGDVAAMVAFLLSDDSATCTGADFLVDAGASA